MAKKTTDFTENLKYYRKKRGFTQQRLAEALKISRNTYAHYENGYYTPDINLLVEIAGALNCTVTSLLSEHENEERSILRAISESDSRFLEAYRSLDDANKKLLIDYLDFIERNADINSTTENKAV